MFSNPNTWSYGVFPIEEVLHTSTSRFNVGSSNIDNLGSGWTKKDPVNRIYPTSSDQKFYDESNKNVINFPGFSNRPIIGNYCVNSSTSEIVEFEEIIEEEDCGSIFNENPNHPNNYIGRDNLTSLKCYERPRVITTLGTGHTPSDTNMGPGHHKNSTKSSCNRDNTFESDRVLYKGSSEAVTSDFSKRDRSPPNINRIYNSPPRKSDNIEGVKQEPYYRRRSFSPNTPLKSEDPYTELSYSPNTPVKSEEPYFDLGPVTAKDEDFNKSTSVKELLNTDNSKLQLSPINSKKADSGDSDDEIAELRIQALLTKRVNEAEVSPSMDHFGNIRGQHSNMSGFHQDHYGSCDSELKSFNKNIVVLTCHQSTDGWQGNSRHHSDIHSSSRSNEGRWMNKTKREMFSHKTNRQPGPKLVLPQDRYSGKIYKHEETDDKSKKVSAKWQRFQGSNSDTSEDSESDSSNSSSSDSSSNTSTSSGSSSDSSSVSSSDSDSDNESKPKGTGNVTVKKKKTSVKEHSKVPIGHQKVTSQKHITPKEPTPPLSLRATPPPRQPPPMFFPKLDSESLSFERHCSNLESNSLNSQSPQRPNVLKGSDTLSSISPARKVHDHNFRSRSRSYSPKAGIYKPRSPRNFGSKSPTGRRPISPDARRRMRGSLSPLLRRPSRSPSFRRLGSRSPVTRKLGSRSPPRNFLTRSPPPRRFGSRSPPPRRFGSRSPPSRRLGSRSPPPRRLGSRSPPPRRLGSRSPPPRRLGSRSPPPRRLGSRSPPPRRLGSLSPTPRRFGSRSPPLRRLGSRSPLLRRVRSRTPPLRRIGSRSPPPRRFSSRSPPLRRLGSRSPSFRKTGMKSPLFRRFGSRSPSPRRMGTPPPHRIGSRSPPLRRIESRSPLRRRLGTPSRRRVSSSISPKRFGSRSPIPRKGKVFSPTAKNLGRSSPYRRFNSRSPPRRLTSRSPRRFGSRSLSPRPGMIKSRSPLSKKFNSRSPSPRRFGSRPSPSRRFKSPSPTTKGLISSRSPPKRFVSRSPTQRHFDSGSSPPRKLGESRSPLSRNFTSKSPPLQALHSKSPPPHRAGLFTRRFNSKSPPPSRRIGSKSPQRKSRSPSHKGSYSKAFTQPLKAGKSPRKKGSRSPKRIYSKSPRRKDSKSPISKRIGSPSSILGDSKPLSTHKKRKSKSPSHSQTLQKTISNSPKRPTSPTLKLSNSEIVLKGKELQSPLDHRASESSTISLHKPLSPVRRPKGIEMLSPKITNSQSPPRKIFSQEHSSVQQRIGSESSIHKKISQDSRSKSPLLRKSRSQSPKGKRSFIKQNSQPKLKQPPSGPKNPRSLSPISPSGSIGQAKKGSLSPDNKRLNSLSPKARRQSPWHGPPRTRSQSPFYGRMNSRSPPPRARYPEKMQFHRVGSPNFDKHFYKSPRRSRSPPHRGRSRSFHSRRSFSPNDYNNSNIVAPLSPNFQDPSMAAFNRPLELDERDRSCSPRYHRLAVSPRIRSGSPLPWNLQAPNRMNVGVYSNAQDTGHPSRCWSPNQQQPHHYGGPETHRVWSHSPPSLHALNRSQSPKNWNARNQGIHPRQNQSRPPDYQMPQHTEQYSHIQPHYASNQQHGHFVDDGRFADQPLNENPGHYIGDRLRSPRGRRMGRGRNGQGRNPVNQQRYCPDNMQRIRRNSGPNSFGVSPLPGGNSPHRNFPMNDNRGPGWDRDFRISPSRRGFVRGRGRGQSNQPRGPRGTSLERPYWHHNTDKSGFSQRGRKGPQTPPSSPRNLNFRRRKPRTGSPNAEHTPSLSPSPPQTEGQQTLRHTQSINNTQNRPRGNDSDSNRINKFDRIESKKNVNSQPIEKGRGGYPANEEKGARYHYGNEHRKHGSGNERNFDHDREVDGNAEVSSKYDKQEAFDGTGPGYADQRKRHRRSRSPMNQQEDCGPKFSHNQGRDADLKDNSDGKRQLTKHRSFDRRHNEKHRDLDNKRENIRHKDEFGRKEESTYKDHEKRDVNDKPNLNNNKKRENRDRDGSGKRKGGLDNLKDNDNRRLKSSKSESSQKHKGFNNDKHDSNKRSVNERKYDNEKGDSSKERKRGDNYDDRSRHKRRKTPTKHSSLDQEDNVKGKDETANKPEKESSHKKSSLSHSERERERDASPSTDFGKEGNSNKEREKTNKEERIDKDKRKKRKSDENFKELEKKKDQKKKKKEKKKKKDVKKKKKKHKKADSSASDTESPSPPKQKKKMSGDDDDDDVDVPHLNKRKRPHMDLHEGDDKNSAERKPKRFQDEALHDKNDDNPSNKNKSSDVLDRITDFSRHVTLTDAPTRERSPKRVCAHDRLGPSINEGFNTGANKKPGNYGTNWKNRFGSKQARGGRYHKGRNN